MDHPEPAPPDFSVPASKEALRLKLTFAPAYLAVRSVSDYSYRRLSVDAPGGSLGLELWPSADFAVKLNYFTSLAASVAEGAAGNASLEFQKVELGARWRLEINGAHFEYGFDVQDVRERLSRDASAHIGSANTGLNFKLGAEVAGPGAYSHTLSFGFEPLLVTTEEGSFLRVRSGNQARAYALAGSFGGIWVLRPTGIRPNREALFWRGDVRWQRSLFGGDASQPDPLTAVVPRDVEVTETTTTVYLGFSWGS